ncbi:MAG: hypothetical protein ACTS3F_01970 [Phycisphaerales bacterium]
MNTSHRSIRRCASGLSRTTIASLALGALSITQPAIAASDRVLEFVSVTPSQTLEGAWDITAHSRLLIADQPVLPANLSTRVEFRLNGSLLDIVDFDHWVAQHNNSGCPCGLSCYTGTLNGQPDNGTCIPYSSPPTLDECRCVSGGIDTTLPGEITALVLLPGDIIEVRLVPAPGALPDDPTNNASVFSFNGAPREILRTIESVGIEQGDNGPELAVRISVASFNAEGPIGNVGFDSAVTLLGYNPPPGLPATVTISKWPFSFGCRHTFAFFGCGGTGCSDPSGCPAALGCLPIPVLGRTFECVKWKFPNLCPQPPCSPPFFEICGCKVVGTIGFPISVVGLTQGQSVGIKLETAPGGTSDVNTDDNFLTYVIPTEPCPGDTNADGVVDSDDLGALLGQFGIPCP